MRPRAPGFHPSVPAPNPQVGRALPEGIEGPASGVVHSRQVFWFGVDGGHPLANTATVAAAAGDSTFGLLHYNGTLYQIGTAAVAEAGISVSFYHADMATMTVPDAIAHMANRLNGIGDAGLSAVRGTGFWPWSARLVHELTPFGDLWYGLEISRGYPAGTPGTEASRPVPIVGHLPAGAQSGSVVLAPELPSSGGNNLLGVSLSRYYPGERGYDMCPARFSKANRAVLPLTYATNGGTEETVPYEIPQPG